MGVNKSVYLFFSLGRASLSPLPRARTRTSPALLVGAALLAGAAVPLPMRCRAHQRGSPAPGAMALLAGVMGLLVDAAVILPAWRRARRRGGLLSNAASGPRHGGLHGLRCQAAGDRRKRRK